MTHQQKAEIYDKFADYVRERMRDKDNPNLSVQEFDLMRKSGVTHMELVLENVNKAKKKLYDLVEAFDSRASLTSKESIATGNPIFVANIPFIDPADEKKHHHTKSGRRDFDPDEPSTNWLFLYAFLFLCLVILGMWKTRWEEWAYLFYGGAGSGEL